MGLGPTQYKGWGRVPLNSNPPPPPFRSPELLERAGTFCRNVVIL